MIIIVFPQNLRYAIVVVHFDLHCAFYFEGEIGSVNSITLTLPLRMWGSEEAFIEADTQWRPVFPQRQIHAIAVDPAIISLRIQNNSIAYRNRAQSITSRNNARCVTLH